MLYVFPGIQSLCKVAAKRMAWSKDRYKVEERCHAFLLLLVNSWAQGVNAFQEKQVEHLLHIHIYVPDSLLKKEKTFKIKGMEEIYCRGNSTNTGDGFHRNKSNIGKLLDCQKRRSGGPRCQ
jgi:hypothetical protein